MLPQCRFFGNPVFRRPRFENPRKKNFKIQVGGYTCYCAPLGPWGCQVGLQYGPLGLTGAAWGPGWAQAHQFPRSC